MINIAQMVVFIIVVEIVMRRSIRQCRLLWIVYWRKMCPHDEDDKDEKRNDDENALIVNNSDSANGHSRLDDSAVQIEQKD